MGRAVAYKATERGIVLLMLTFYQPLSVIASDATSPRGEAMCQMFCLNLLSSYPNYNTEEQYMRIITGKARGLQLTVPKTYDVRPTADRVKESVFNIIGSKIIGAEVLDLFAGTGNLGLESWSRGAAAVTFIDASKESLRLVRSNIVKCRAEADCRVLQGSAPAVAERLAAAGELFDFAFCDPPYNKGWIEQIIALLGKKSFLRPGGYLVVERSAHNALPELPAGCELVRSSRYGETIVDFICYNML